MNWSSTASFYDQLRALLSAGIPIATAVELAGKSSSREHAQNAPTWAADCAAGQALADTLARHGESTLVVALVRAGEASGRLPDICREIAAHHRHLQALLSQAIGRLIYPAILLHVALTMMALPKVLAGGSLLWLLAGTTGLWSLLLLARIAFAWAGPVCAAQVALSRGLRPLTMPLVAGNTCMVLRACFGAGMLIPAALTIAAEGCGNRVMAGRLRHAGSEVLNGRLPSLAAALGTCDFPVEVVQLVAGGEAAGKVDDTLERCTVMMQERFRLRSEWTARVITGTIYGIAITAAAGTVIMMWASIYGHAMDSARQAGEE